MKFDPFKPVCIFGLFVFAALFAVALTGCQGLTGSVSTPWGDVTTDNGKTVVAPKPIVIPDK